MISRKNRARCSLLPPRFPIPATPRSKYIASSYPKQRSFVPWHEAQKTHGYLQTSATREGLRGNLRCVHALRATVALKLGPDARGADCRGDGHRVGPAVSTASTTTTSVADELRLGHSFAHGGRGREAARGDVYLTGGGREEVVHRSYGTVDVIISYGGWELLRWRLSV